MFDNTIKDQITPNKRSVNVTRRTFVFNFDRTLPEHSDTVPCSLGWLTGISFSQTFIISLKYHEHVNIFCMLELWNCSLFITRHADSLLCRERTSTVWHHEGPSALLCKSGKLSPNSLLHMESHSLRCQNMELHPAERIGHVWTSVDRLSGLFLRLLFHWQGMFEKRKNWGQTKSFYQVSHMQSLWRKITNEICYACYSIRDEILLLLSALKKKVGVLLYFLAIQ